MKEYNKDLCDERHINLDKALDRVFKKMGALSDKLNWFYIITIATLIGVVANLVKSVL